MANKIEIPFAAANHGLDSGILAFKSFHIPYKDGKPLSDQRTEVHLGLSLLGDQMSTLVVRFISDPLPDLSPEKIAEGLMQHKFIYVKPLDCVVTFYVMDKKLNKSAIAKGAEIVGSNNK